MNEQMSMNYHEVLETLGSMEQEAYNDYNQRLTARIGKLLERAGRMYDADKIDIKNAVPELAESVPEGLDVSLVSDSGLKSGRDVMLYQRIKNLLLQCSAPTQLVHSLYKDHAHAAMYGISLYEQRRLEDADVPFHPVQRILETFIEKDMQELLYE